jgi:PAS domain S-box-containing protein
MFGKSLPAAPRRKSLRTALFLGAFFRLTFVVIVTTIVAYILVDNAFRSRIMLQLQSAATARESMIENTIAKQREQLSILGRDPALVALPSIESLVGFRELYLIRTDRTTQRLSSVSTNTLPLQEGILESMLQSSTSTISAAISQDGWTQYLISTPQIDGAGRRTGTLVATFDPGDFLARILDTSFLGTTAEVLLVTREKSDFIVIKADGEQHRTELIRIPSTADKKIKLLRDAAERDAATAEGVDYAGIPVIAAYHDLSTLGWGILVKIDRYEIMLPIIRLAGNLASAGLLLVGLLSLSVFLLASHIVRPLEELANKLNGLEVKHWRYQRSIHTHNEIEIVDDAADKLTMRLREAHEHLESIVRKRTEALREQHAKDEAILQNIDYGLIVTDSEGKVTYLNGAGELLTGWSAKDAIGKQFEGILHIITRDGKDVGIEHHPITTVFNSGKRFNPETDPEYSLRQKSGEVSAVQVRVTPIQRGRQKLGTVTVFRDITEERKIDHMKSEFISLVSHQLRTPLSSMRWYLEMLLAKDSGPLTETQKEYVEEVTASNARMVHLVNALLNVSRLELGNVQVTPEAIDLAALVHDITVSFRLDLERKRMTITYVGDAKKPIEIRSDRGLVQLIIENIVSNAIKYGKEKWASPLQTKVLASFGRNRKTFSQSCSAEVTHGSPIQTGADWGSMFHASPQRASEQLCPSRVRRVARQYSQ